MLNTLTGTGSLIRLILRRDRIVMPLWMLWLTAIPVIFTITFAELYPTAAERDRFVATSGSNTALTALYGPIHDSSVGALTAWRLSIATIIVGVIALLTVIRHTRAEEESGRWELLASTVVGRHAGLAAALITACGASLALGLLIFCGLTVQGQPAAGSLAFGLQLALAGWIFAAIGAVAAQLTEGSGAARGLGVGAVGGFYLLRVGGDSSLPWLSWLTPLGWLQSVRPFAGDRWELLIPVVGLFAALCALAVLLSARRDVGGGLLPSRLGPPTAPPRLGGPLGLAWRLHRGLLAGWVAGFAVIGLVIGSIVDGIGDLVVDNKELEQLLQRLGGQDVLVNAFLATITTFYGLVAASYAVQATLRLRSEELATRLEPVLSTAVGRVRWAASHLVFAALGPALALLTAGAMTGLVHGLQTSDVAGQLPRAVQAAVVQLPAVWLLAGVAMALFGLLPRHAAVAWGALVWSLLVTLFGPALRLDQWLLDLSPFTHVPRIPDFRWVPLVWLTVIAIALAVVGLSAFRRRDVPIP